MKKQWVILALGAAIAAGTGQSFAAGEPLDKIIAVVNDDVVTTSELNQALATAKAQIAQANIPAPSEQVLHKQVLDQLINKKLQLQIAKQANIDVSKSDLDQAVERIAEQNHVSVASVYDHVHQAGMTTNAYRKEMHDEILIQKLQQQEVVNHITVSTQEIDNFMHSTAMHANDPKEYRLDDLLIPLSDAPSPAEIAKARKHAEAVLTSIRAGQSFKAAAQAESADSHALQGGDLGWRPITEIPSAFTDSVIHMTANQVSGPIQTPNGFHLLHLSGVRALGTPVSAPNRQEIEQLLMRRKFDEAVQNWVSKMRNQAFITMNDGKSDTGTVLS